MLSVCEFSPLSQALNQGIPTLLRGSQVEQLHGQALELGSTTLLPWDLEELLKLTFKI